MRRRPKRPKTAEIPKYFLKFGFSTFFTPNPNSPKPKPNKPQTQQERSYSALKLSYFQKYRGFPLKMPLN